MKKNNERKYCFLDKTFLALVYGVLKIYNIFLLEELEMRIS